MTPEAKEFTITLLGWNRANDASNSVMSDFDTIIDLCVPLIVDEQGKINVGDSGEVRSVDLAYFKEATEAGKHFICFDAVDVHRKLLAAAKASKKKRKVVWSLSNGYLLWDVGLLEQRIVWATEGKAIPFPEIFPLIQKYEVSAKDQYECLRQLLRQQFRFLVKNMPYSYGISWRLPTYTAQLAPSSENGMMNHRGHGVSQRKQRANTQNRRFGHKMIEGLLCVLSAP